MQELREWQTGHFNSLLVWLFHFLTLTTNVAYFYCVQNTNIALDSRAFCKKGSTLLLVTTEYSNKTLQLSIAHNYSISTCLQHLHKKLSQFSQTLVSLSYSTHYKPSKLAWLNSKVFSKVATFAPMEKKCRQIASFGGPFMSHFSHGIIFPQILVKRFWNRYRRGFHNQSRLLESWRIKITLALDTPFTPRNMIPPF